jgi:AcrR family transcriptional regulator
MNGGSSAPPPGRRLLPRAERREQIVAAAKRAFGRTGYAGTSLEDVGREAGVSKVILYRHFESKAELYRVALDDVAGRIADALGGVEGVGPGALSALLHVADADPAGYLLLFRHATREPEFREHTDTLHAQAANALATITDVPATGWSRELLPHLVIAAIATWLLAGRPTPVGEATQSLTTLITSTTRTLG